LEEERTFLLAQSVVMAAEREAFPTLADDPSVAAHVAATEAALVEVDDALARMDTGEYHGAARDYRTGDLRPPRRHRDREPQEQLTAS
jgi:hypothetical protein